MSQRPLAALMASSAVWVLATATGGGAWAAPALPTGGAVAAGKASLSQSGSTLTVTQSSSRSIIDWSSFSIAAGHTVQFDNGSGATLNRVLTGGPLSEIEGDLSATGSVYLINSSGVIVGKSGVIKVGGSFVASTIDIADTAFMAGGDLTFSASSQAAIINYGKIGSLGGDIVLSAATVTNAGTLTAPNGEIGLLAGTQVLLRDQADLGGKFAVEIGAAGTSLTNSGDIAAAAAELRAENGNIYALAGNTQGVIRATEVSGQGGQIELTSVGGSVDVAAGATLDASASGVGDGGHIYVDSAATTFAGTALAKGGAGGLIETSGTTLNIDGATVNAGVGGQWRLDPTTLTIDTTAATSIDASLAAGTAVSESATSSLTVLAPISWSTSAGLTLTSSGTLTIDAPITISGAGQLTLNSSTSSATNLSFGLTPNGFTGSINYGATNHGGSLTINGQAYQLIYNLGAPGSTTATDFTGIDSTGDSGYYALATPLTASQSYTAALAGGGGFGGTFEGLGNTITGLTITGSSSNAGLFLRSTGTIRDIGLVGGSVSGNLLIGGLVGEQDGGSIANAYATGAVSGADIVGGLVGYQQNGSITNAFATGAVNVGSGAKAGGLVGEQDAGSITASYATGAVSGSAELGGLVGSQGGGSITEAYATGAVSGSSGGDQIGGLIGSQIGGSVSNVYATGAVSVASGDNEIGGLVGYQTAGSVTNGYYDTQTTDQTTDGANATGVTTAQLASATVLTALNSGGTAWGNATNQTTPYLLNLLGPVFLAIDTSTTPTVYTPILTAAGLQAVNNNTSANYVLANSLDLTAITYTSAVISTFSGTFEGLNNTITGLTITGASNDTGLFGRSTGTIRDIGLIGGSVSGYEYIGGLVGVQSGGSVTNAYATTAVSGTAIAGGLVGVQVNGSISNAYTAGAVSASIFGAGGLVGQQNAGSIMEGYATGAVSGHNQIGGLVGTEDGGSISEAYATGAVSGASYIGGLVGLQVSGSITEAFATGAVSGTSSFGGLVGTKDSGSVVNGYYDTQTTGRSTDGAGATSLTTAEFQNATSASGLGGAFTFTSGLYPYLTALFPNGVQAVSGIAYTNSSGAPPVAAASGSSGAVTVGLTVGGVSQTSVTTGANGYYYFALPAGTISTSGTSVLAYTTAAGNATNAATLNTLLVAPSSTGAAATNLYIVGSTLTETSDASIATLSGLNTALTTAAGSTGVAGFSFTNQAITTAASSFAIDTAPVATSAGFLGLSSTGSVTQGTGAGAAITAGALALAGTGGAYILTNSANSFSTLAAATGAVTVASSASTLTVGTVDALSGVTSSSAVNIATTGALTLSSGVTAGSGANVVLSAAGAFTNTAGASAVTTSGGGVWDIYSANPANDTFGSLASGNTAVWDTAAGASITQTGDRYVFAYQPTLTVTTTNDTKTYGLTTTTHGLASDYTITGLYAGAGSGTAFTADTAADVYSGAPTISSSGTAASANVGGGTGTGGAYTITASATGLTIGDGYSATPTFMNTGLLTLSPEAITVTAAAGSKVYDGGVASILAPTVTNGVLYSGDATLSETYNTKDVNTATTLTPAELFATGKSVDYTVTNVSAAGAITPYTLTASLIGSVSKAYDSSNTATLTSSNYGLSSAFGTDAVAVNGPTAGTYGSVNAASGIAVSVSGLTLTNNAAGDYQLASTSLSANIGVITAEAITLTANSNTKVYDGGTTASATPTVTGLLYGGVGAVETYASQNVGNSIVLTPALSGLTAATSADYTVSAVTAAGGITPYTLTASLTGSVAKTYDSTTAATLSSANYSLSSALGTDAVALNGPTAGTFASVNAGTGIGVSVSGLTLANNTAGDYQLASTNLSANIGTITAEAITVTAAGGSKTYDGSTASSLTPTVTSGTLYSGDATLSETYNTKDVTTATTLTPAEAFASGKSVDYIVTNATAAGTITPYTLTAILTGSVSKPYDATSAATLTSANYGLTSALGSDAVSLNGPTSGSYASVNAGTGIGVSVSGLTLSNNTAGDYQLASTSLTANIGTITAEAITVTAAGGSKTYDGSTASSLTPTVTSGTLYSGDATLSETYNTKDVNTAATLTPAEAFATGKSVDYTVTNATTAGTITPYTLTASLTGSVSKTYDSTNTATLTSANYSLTPALGLDAVSLNGPISGTYASVNAGTGIGVGVSGLTLANNTAGDYQLAASSLSANIGTITAEAITVTAAGGSKTYDGSTASSLTPTVTSGTLYSGDATLSETYNTKDVNTATTLTPAEAFATGKSVDYTVTNTTAAGTITPYTLTASLGGSVSKTYDSTNSATLTNANYRLTSAIGADAVALNGPTAGTYASVNTASGIGVSVSGLTLGNNSAGDYQLASTSLSANIGTITAEAITVTAAAGGKVYDGGTASSLTPTVTSGTLYSADAALSETYNSRDVNTATTLTPAEAFATGKSVDYIVTNATAAGTITPYTLAASLTGSVSKTYDSTTAATLTSANYSLTSALGSDTVGVVGPASGTYVSANAASGIGVAVSGLTLANNSAGDYQLSSTSLSANIGTITAEAITIAAAPNTKVYDGGTAAAATPTVTGTIYGADSLSEAYTTANAGAALTLVPSATIANASNYAITYVSSTAGTITPAPLSAALTSSVDKTYDGTTTATLTPSDYTLTGFIAGQGATVTQTVGAYASANVGTGIGVSAILTDSNFTSVSNTLLSNYALPTVAAGAVGEIDAAAVTPVFKPNLVSYPANGTSDASAHDLTRLFSDAASDGVANPGQTVTQDAAPSDSSRGPVPIYPDNQWVSDSIHFKVGTR